MRTRFFLLPALLTSLSAPQASAPVQTDPQPAVCPPSVAAGSRCLTGRDPMGAYLWFAVPPDWNGTLVVHAHGGPELGEPRAERAAQDLTRWAIWTRAGYAYAGTGYHQGGVAVRSAAEDLERARSMFVATIGQPARTVLHGQSWGASVAARAAEIHGADIDGRPPYDAVLLTSGVLGGGSQSYAFRFDLRVVYQAVCGNHPRADESPYPLWQGLPLSSTLTRAQLAERVDECTGVRQPVEKRSAAQRQHLRDILGAVPVAEDALLGHLNWATWHFQDIVFNRLGGRNPFGNIGVRYRGSDDDESLNALAFRAAPDSAALADFSADTDPQGRIPMPVITLHARHDPTASVTLEALFRETMRRGNGTGRLVQLFTDDREHSYLSDAQYVVAMQALLQWVERGVKPTPASVARQCRALDAKFAPATGCRFLPDYMPPMPAARVNEKAPTVR